MTDTLAAPAFENAAQLPDDVRGSLRDLILALADSKRVLGLRYSDRMLGSPTLEAGIAASSMAQDEWGHARLDQGAHHPRGPRDAAHLRRVDVKTAVLGARCWVLRYFTSHRTWH